MEIKSEILKLYSCYLLNEFRKFPNHQDSRIFWELTQFYNEGRIKGLISKNDKISKKSYMLQSMGNEISRFLSVPILGLIDFWNLRNSELKSRIRNSKIDKILK